MSDEDNDPGPVTPCDSAFDPSECHFVAIECVWCKPTTRCVFYDYCRNATLPACPEYTAPDLGFDTFQYCDLEVSWWGVLLGVWGTVAVCLALAVLHRRYGKLWPYANTVLVAHAVFTIAMLLTAEWGWGISQWVLLGVSIGTGLVVILVCVFVAWIRVRRAQFHGFDTMLRSVQGTAATGLLLVGLSLMLSSFREFATGDLHGAAWVVSATTAGLTWCFLVCRVDLWPESEVASDGSLTTPASSLLVGTTLAVVCSQILFLIIPRHKNVMQGLSVALSLLFVAHGESQQHTYFAASTVILLGLAAGLFCMVGIMVLFSPLVQSALVVFMPLFTAIVMESLRKTGRFSREAIAAYYGFDDGERGHQAVVVRSLAALPNAITLRISPWQR